MKQNRRRWRILSLAMALMMLLTAFPVAAFAEEGETTADGGAMEPILSDGEMPSADAEAATGAAALTAANVPEFIALSDLTARGTVRRLYGEEEDLNTVLFENNDGTRTAYMYSVPVKYVAPDGTTRDKSTAISTLSGLQPLWNGSTLSLRQANALTQRAVIGRAWTWMRQRTR